MNQQNQQFQQFTNKQQVQQPGTGQQFIPNQAATKFYTQKEFQQQHDQLIKPVTFQFQPSPKPQINNPTNNTGPNITKNQPNITQTGDQGQYQNINNDNFKPKFNPNPTFSQPNPFGQPQPISQPKPNPNTFNHANFNHNIQQQQQQKYEPFEVKNEQDKINLVEQFCQYLKEGNPNFAISCLKQIIDMDIRVKISNQSINVN
ncbi:unnamed protein product [Paramecium sonneborni]|uniref:Uncharacterized protein n=1 Tax=Paramecium sonneborni TaxID=65129 RepID=A0A8S1LXN9_9CILI|nr:unnamed protein product [Paramecium sonneborni]